MATPSSPSPDDVEAAKVLNDIARRVIWVAATLVCLRGSMTKAAAERGDEVLTQYDRRFDPIQP